MDQQDHKMDQQDHKMDQQDQKTNPSDLTDEELRLCRLYLARRKSKETMRAKRQEKIKAKTEQRRKEKEASETAKAWRLEERIRKCYGTMMPRDATLIMKNLLDVFYEANRPSNNNPILFKEDLPATEFTPSLKNILKASYQDFFLLTKKLGMYPSWFKSLSSWSKSAHPLTEQTIYFIDLGQRIRKTKLTIDGLLYDIAVIDKGNGRKAFRPSLYIHTTNEEVPLLSVWMYHTQWSFFPIIAMARSDKKEPEDIEETKPWELHETIRLWDKMEERGWNWGNKDD